MKKRNKHILSLCITVSLMMNNSITAFASTDETVKPHQASYGFYVDVYENNNSDNYTPESNPSIGVLSKFLDLWQPGTEWNNGTKLNPTVLDKNIESSKKISSSRTKEDERKAYLDDRRDQNYSIITGLGPYADEFKKGSKAGTTIPDEIPADASTTLYSDAGNINGNWAEENSTYGNMVKLVNTLRNSAASTSSAKKYYKYMRPFRWENGSIIQDSLIPAKKSDPSNDGGFPSGHTNAAYLSALGLAYAFPERYDELLTRASELGNNRIVCGMHSCLDVIGGRVMATAIAASALNDPDNKDIKNSALQTGKLLMSQQVSGSDDYADYETNKQKYIERLTYGFEQTGDTTKPMRVPKGAEVLLESRLPYLDSTQRRYVLYTTGLPSGYPVLDDEEGWGRLNLFEASNGYGSFVTDVTVNMDSARGGFNAADNWRNDIDGTGSLTKEGSGSLTLSGNNSYTGNTVINGGTINAASKSALGYGNVTNNSILTESTKETTNIGGSYSQSDSSTLELNISNSTDILKISGNANLHGNLVLNFEYGYIPEDDLIVLSYASNSGTKFDNITITGAPDKEAVYTDKGITIKNKSTISENAPENKNESPSNIENTSNITSNNEGISTSHESTPKTGDNSILLACMAACMLYFIKKNFKFKNI